MEATGGSDEDLIDRASGLDDERELNDPERAGDSKPDGLQKLEEAKSLRGDVICTETGDPASRYKLGKKLGQGSFGVVFEGTRLLGRKEAVAVKFEPRNSKTPQLRDEYRAYKALAGCKGIANCFYFGQLGLHNILIIDRLGPSLENLFDDCGRKFSPKTLAMVALTVVEGVHGKNLVYRDIKPDNFLTGIPGTKTASEIYLIDLGMTKPYRDSKTKEHIPYKENKSLSGTARYMSINTHLGREQSRRDDLEALGHVFVYFVRGRLPWQGIKAETNAQKYWKIGKEKRATAIDALCKGLPTEVGRYLDYVRNMGFEDTPDYDHLRGLFTQLLRNANEADDGKFDWTDAQTFTSLRTQDELCKQEQIYGAGQSRGDERDVGTQSEAELKRLGA